MLVVVSQVCLFKFALFKICASCWYLQTTSADCREISATPWCNSWSSTAMIPKSVICLLASAGALIWHVCGWTTALWYGRWTILLCKARTVFFVISQIGNQQMFMRHPSSFNEFHKTHPMCQMCYPRTMYQDCRDFTRNSWKKQTNNFESNMIFLAKMLTNKPNCHVCMLYASRITEHFITLRHRDSCVRYLSEIVHDLSIQARIKQKIVVLTKNIK